jgi:glucose/mannose transport system substrate-binding protein
MRKTPSIRINRRQFAAGSAALAAVPLLPGLRVTAQEASPVAEDQLEIFSWWTTGGEAAGLDELFKVFSDNNPDVEVVNAAVAGGAGSNAQVALQTRLGGGDPPDSWQSHPGEELWNLYVDPGYAVPLTSIWEEEGWGDVIPQGLIDQVTRDGEQYLIPVGVHRGNVMFYNRTVMADNGIEVGDTMTAEQFLAAAETLKAAGIPAIALGSKDTFAAPQLFENILVAVLGAEGYAGLWDGSTGWDSAEVTTAIEQFAQYLDYVNEDHAALTWDGANDLVIQGTAGFTSMGDWAYGDAVAKDATADYGWVAHAGTDGSFVAVVDGFTLPDNVPHPNNAANWLRAAGSADAQAAFAPLKGCIPARTDADTSGLSDYGQWSAEGFGGGTVVASNAHGAAASPQFRQSIFDATITFLVDKDVATYQEELQFAAEDAALGE